MQSNSKVYLDFNATTPLLPEVTTFVRDFLANEQASFGNPSSIHWAGRGVKPRLRETRARLASYFQVGLLELVFTSGGSESNNTVIRGLADMLMGQTLPAKFKGRDEFIVSKIEHPATLRAIDHLEARGFKVHRIDVNRDGQLDIETFKSVLSEKTLLVSIMMANNETGTIFPVGRFAKWAHKVGALFHTDAVQALGKIPINLKALDVDYASFSAHKFYSLKGAGLLYVKQGSPYQNLVFGSQERARRGGTENVLGILAFGEAAKKLPEVETRAQSVQVLRDHLEKRIMSEIPDIFLTSSGPDRLPNTTSLVVDGVDGETLLMSLDLSGFAVSTGAACASGNPEPSPVLLAMGLTREEAQRSLRISLGWPTTLEDVDRFIDELARIVKHLRSLTQPVSPLSKIQEVHP